MQHASTHAFLLGASAILSMACSGKTQTVSDNANPGSSTGGSGGVTMADATLPTGDTTPPVMDAVTMVEADVSIDGTTPAKCVRVPPDGLITDFSKPCPADAASAGQACFGQWGQTVFGATWPPYPKPEGGTDMSPTHGDLCTTYGSQSTLVSSVDTGAWVLSGTVATWSGVGLWLAPCVDASAFKGIQFTVSGDAGPAGIMTFSVTQLSNWSQTDAGGACNDTCKAASSSFNVTSTPATISVLWADLTGGSPTDSIDAPAGIASMAFELDWPCGGGTPYPVNITIDDLKFFK